MTSDQFAYWLQGFAELNAAPPTEGQWTMIRDHLALVFDKRTPTYNPRRDLFIGNEWQWPKEALDQLGRLKVTCVATPQIGARTIC